MKAILEFTLPEDTVDMNMAVDAAIMSEFIHNFRHWLVNEWDGKADVIKRFHAMYQESGLDLTRHE